MKKEKIFRTIKELREYYKPEDEFAKRLKGKSRWYKVGARAAHEVIEQAKGVDDE